MPIFLVILISSLFSTLASADESAPQCSTFSFAKPIEPRSTPGWKAIEISLFLVDKVERSRWEAVWTFRTEEASDLGPEGTEFKTERAHGFVDAPEFVVGSSIAKARVKFFESPQGPKSMSVDTPLSWLPKVLSAADYDALTNNQKDVLEDDYSLDEAQAMGIRTFECEAIQMTDVSHLPFGKEIAAFVAQNIDTSVDADLPYVEVGPVRKTLRWMVTPDEKVVAANINLHQLGGMVADDYEGEMFFETEEAARAAGVDLDSDVSWSSYATFRAVGSELKANRYVDYLEWSGH